MVPLRSAPIAPGSDERPIATDNWYVEAGFHPRHSGHASNCSKLGLFRRWPTQLCADKGTEGGTDGLSRHRLTETERQTDRQTDSERESEKEGNRLAE